MGKFTGTRFKACLSSPTSETFKTMVASVLKERLIVSHNQIDTKALEHGRDMEPKALDMYRFVFGGDVQEVGFINHYQYDFCGVSPDFLVGENGGGEIKCPHNTDIHLKTIIADEMPSEHKPQVQGAMWVTGREWWDFISYDPRLPHGDFFCKRIYRDDKYIEKLEEAVLVAEKKVRQAFNKIIGGTNG